ncbi:MAG: C4-type zinc ribbon domain-containing protein [Actinomycetota bacterium]|nr:C4-type zinc ribbon domain-containing protein [Actinomycetota bacterium]
MTAFEALLEVQDRDTTGDQLRHRRAHLPERSELAALDARLAALDARLVEARARRDQVAGRQARLEEDVRLVEARIAEIEKRLYSGVVSAPRDLQAMSAESDSLKARLSMLEDQALAAMEEAESSAAEVGALEGERSEVEAQAAQVRGFLAAAEEAIDTDIAVEESKRASAAQSVPADLLRTYEGLRAKLGGVGAARLVGSSCSGCHLALPAAEVDRIKREPPGALVFCDQCGRILVR